MNTSHKVCRYSLIVLRILMGALFCFGGFSYFWMKSMPMDPATPAGKFAIALCATGYFFPFLKLSEGIAGILLFFKRSTPFALLILAPIILNIALFALFLDRSGLPMACVLLLFLGILAWENWDKYKSIFQA